MISAEGTRRYCRTMCVAGVVYLWGADVQIITAKLLEDLKKHFGASHYEGIHLEDVEGRIGADCSGFLKPLSGVDLTAEGYYKQCKVKGKATDLPADMTSLLFRQEAVKIVHVAIYTGDGMLTEMYDGCEQRAFDPSEWTFYGIPDWIEQQTAKKPLAAGDKVKVTKELTGHNTAADAMAGRAVRNRVVPGEYYVYKVYGGAVNVSKIKNCPGSWVVL